MELSYTAELRRKAIHLPALMLPLAILALDRPVAILGLWALAAVTAGFDLARQRVPAVQRFVLSLFGPVMRPEEIEQSNGPIQFNGATWVCIAAALCGTLFAPGIGAAALAIMMLGDAAAAVIGRKLGYTHIPQTGKTLEGSIAFVAVGAFGAFLATLWPAISLSPVQIAAGVFLGMAAEAVPIPLNDNVTVPLAAGVAMTLLTG